MKDTYPRMRLVDRRNYKLVARYYWYSNIIQFNTDRSLRLLSREFDLSTVTIYQLVSKNGRVLRKLAEEGITAKQLAEWLPQYNWNPTYSHAIPSSSFEQWFLDQSE